MPVRRREVLLDKRLQHALGRRHEVHQLLLALQSLVRLLRASPVDWRLMTTTGGLELQLRGQGLAGVLVNSVDDLDLCLGRVWAAGEQKPRHVGRGEQESR